MANGSHPGEEFVALSAMETRDQFSILMQGLSNTMGVLSALNKKVDKIMTSNQDVMNAIAALTTAQTALSTSIATAIADMGTGGDAARAAMVTALQAVAAQMATSQAELLAAIAAQTPPPAPPATA